jgi:hypothetical protein
MRAEALAASTAAGYVFELTASPFLMMLLAAAWRCHAALSCCRAALELLLLLLVVLVGRGVVVNGDCTFAITVTRCLVRTAVPRV